MKKNVFLGCVLLLTNLLMAMESNGQNDSTSLIELNSPSNAVHLPGRVLTEAGLNRYDIHTLERLSSEDKEKLLWEAYIQEDLASMGALISSGIDVNAHYKPYDETLLYSAARDGKVKMVNMLIDHNANVNEAAHGGMTPLKIACYGHLEVVRLLIMRHAYINGDFFHPTAKRILRDCSPLFDACEAEDIRIPQLLLELGVSANVTNRGQNTRPLHRACCKGNLPLVKCLVEHGAQLNVKDCDGNTPRYYAVLRGYTDCVEYLDSQKKIRGCCSLQ